MSWDNWITRNETEWMSIENYLNFVRPYFKDIRLKKAIAMYLIHNGIRTSHVCELTGFHSSSIYGAMSFKQMQSSRIYRPYISNYSHLFNINVGIAYYSTNDLLVWIVNNNLASPSRRTEYNIMRQSAMHILVTQYVMNPATVAPMFNRDRTTVLHAIKVVDNELSVRHSLYHNIYKQVKEELSCIL